MNSQSLITYKLKYDASEESKAFILKCMKQYTSLLHYGYNRVVDGWTPNQIKDSMKSSLNNVELMDTHMVSCAQQQASGINEQLKKTDDSKIIFGGRKNYIRRCKRLISKEEYQDKRVSPLFSMGESNQKANRKFKINQDLHSITFQIDRHHHYTLELKGIYGKREKILAKLYELQEKKEIPITYSIDKECVYISFDESKVEQYQRKKFIENRVMAIDMNPNYIGWSIVDWKGEGENDFEIVKTGVFSIEKINKIDEQLRKSKTDSEVPKKVYLNNKRTFETYQISKKLIDICLYYQCESFCVEDLDIKTKDSGRGRKYNRLVNNNWCRNKLELNLQKRCNIFDIKFIKTRPDYSSFIGNFLFRSLNLPDMILASVEIGRRGYEFNLQYLKKVKEIKHNIMFPDLGGYKNFYSKSLEEFGIGDATGLKDIYYELKKFKTRYRLSLEETKTEFSRCFSKTSLVMKSIN